MRLNIRVIKYVYIKAVLGPKSIFSKTRRLESLEFEEFKDSKSWTYLT